MARLPQQGSDDGVWGNILNDYLQQTLKTDGTLKDDIITTAMIAPNAVTADSLAPNAVDNAAIADGSIAEAQLDSAVQTKLNATGGTIADGSVTKTKLDSTVQASLDKADAAVSSSVLNSFVAGAGPYTSVVPPRPSTGAFVIWNGTADPAANAQDGDFWIAP